MATITDLLMRLLWWGIGEAPELPETWRARDEACERRERAARLERWHAHADRVIGEALAENGPRGRRGTA